MLFRSNKRELSTPLPSNFSRTLRLIVRAPQLRDNKSLAIVGKDASLGAWDVFKAIPMCEHNYNEWIVDIDASTLKENKLEFKFAAIDNDDDTNTLWEAGFNREIDLKDITDGDVVVYYLDQAFFEISDIKLSGTLVPVFSLRSNASFGIGDFGDLKKVIDWIAATNQRVLQVLPINDTTITHTWTDSYPYSCISIFALHPQYADLTLLPKIKDAKKCAEFESLRIQLNAFAQIDYEKVNDAKTKYLHEIYLQEGKKIFDSAEFKKFFVESESWLVPYAQYSFLRDKNSTADFSKWNGHAAWNEADRKALSTSGDRKSVV